MVIGGDFDGRTIDLGISETVEIRLPENPTTGFRWDLTAKGEPACAMLGDSFATAGVAPGTGGQHSWTFKALRQGECEVELVYRRPWEANDAAERRFRVRLRIASDGRDTTPRPSSQSP